MGIKSLTTFIERRSKQYFENHQLHDCSLVIDGPSLCYCLYNWEYDFWKTGYSYDCYGGDYDKYAETIRAFFEMLELCNVEPYILFGGRNGIDRVSVIKDRLHKKVITAAEVTPDLVRNQLKSDRRHNYKSAGPNQKLTLSAALKFVFRDVVTELNLKRFTCDGEPNQEIACLAKSLNCPVLSANSDFFVLGSMFIPFSSLSSRIEVLRTTGRSRNKKLEQFIPCKMYKVEKLLEALGKPPNHSVILYLLPILVGSEYINPEIFEAFFKSLKLYETERRHMKIEKIFDWIKKQQSLNLAIKVILDTFDSQEKKNSALKQIEHAILAYSPVEVSSLLKYFNTNAAIQYSKPPMETIDKLHGINFSSQLNTNRNSIETCTELFIQRYRECRYPSFFIDMLKEDRYFLQSHIEDFSKPDANSIAYILMSAIHRILVQNEEKQLTVFRRKCGTPIQSIEEYDLPVFTDQLPSIEEIDYLTSTSRLNLLLHILKIDQSFCEIFEHLPKEWHLFLLTLKYITSITQFTPSFMCSLIFCFIILNYVDSNLKGFYRSFKDFQELEEEGNNFRSASNDQENNVFDKISELDSVTFMRKVIRNFTMQKEDNTQNYDREIMHFGAQFQTVFLHLKYLNNLFDFPIWDAVVHKIFDGTFIYNLTKHLMARNLKTYLNNSFLKDCPSIQAGFSYVHELLLKHSIYKPL